MVHEHMASRGHVQMFECIYSFFRLKIYANTKKQVKDSYSLNGEPLFGLLRWNIESAEIPSLATVRR